MDSDDDDDDIKPLPKKPTAVVHSSSSTKPPNKNAGEEMSRYFGMKAAEAAKVMAEAGKLGPQVDREKKVNDKFVRSYCKTLQQVLDAEGGEVASTARAVLVSTSLEDWAREADGWASESTMCLFEESDLPLLQRVKAVDPRQVSQRMGVYACFVHGPAEDDGCHLYVGSATGPKGLHGRMQEHLNPKVTGSRKGVEGQFHRLLHDGKGRTQTWMVFLEVDDPRADNDEEFRTHARISCVSFEAIATDWFNAWFDRGRCRYELVAAAKTAWMGLNFAPPLSQISVMRAAWNEKLSKLRKAKAEKEKRDARRATMTAEELRAELHKKNAPRNAKLAAMSPEEKDAFNATKRAYRHGREAAETAEQRQARLAKETARTK